MRKATRIPYCALAILASLIKYRFNYEWTDLGDDDYVTTFVIGCYEFEVRIHVQGYTYKGKCYDPFYWYEGFAQTGLEVNSISICDEDGETYELCEGYEFAEAALYFIGENSNTFSYENWH